VSPFIFFHSQLSQAPPLKLPLSPLRSLLVLLRSKPKHSISVASTAHLHQGILPQPREHHHFVFAASVTPLNRQTLLCIAPLLRCERCSVANNASPRTLLHASTPSRHASTPSRHASTLPADGPPRLATLTPLAHRHAIFPPLG